MSFHTQTSEPLKPISAVELLTKPRTYWDEHSDLPQLLHESSWAYKLSNLTVLHREHGYEVPLTRITSSTELLDWIFHVNEKSWATPAVVGELVRLLGYIFAEHPAPGGRSIALDIQRAIEGRPLLQRDYH